MKFFKKDIYEICIKEMVVEVFFENVLKYWKHFLYEYEKSILIYI